MTRWLIALLALVTIVILWLTQRQRRAADHRLIASGQRLAGSRLAERAPLVSTPPPAAPPAPPEPSASPEPAPASDSPPGAGPWQEAAQMAAGQTYAQATEQMASLSSELADFRQHAEQSAAKLKHEAAEALAEVQASAETAAPEGAEAVVAEGVAAAGDSTVAEGDDAGRAEDAPPGAVRGNGSRECPAAYPIKGNQSSMLYHEPGSRSYRVTIPEFCFASAASAEAAGFSAPKRG